MHFPCLVQENKLAIGREKQIGHNEDMNLKGYRCHSRAPESDLHAASQPSPWPQIWFAWFIQTGSPSAHPRGALAGQSESPHGNSTSAPLAVGTQIMQCNRIYIQPRAPSLGNATSQSRFASVLYLQCHTVVPIKLECMRYVNVPLSDIKLVLK